MIISTVHTTQNQRRPVYEGTRRRLLLVEEDSNDLKYYFGILNALGYDVIVAVSYTHAMDVLERERVDLVVVGQGSPAFEGRQVVVRALDLYPRIPIVIVARALDIDCYLESMELGAVDYVEKSASPREFMRALDAHLHLEAAA